jgi:hypothetical protein
MTYNTKSKTMSTRINPQALAVLEWHAKVVGVPLRKWLRTLLEERAEQLSAEYNLPEDLTGVVPIAPDQLAAVLDAADEVAAVPTLDRREAFVARLSDALDMDPNTVAALIVEEQDGTLAATIDGTTFTDQPATTAPTSGDA